MGDFFNRGNYGFKKSRNGKYIDKTGLIDFFNSSLFTDNNFLCVTRARRFGKTMAAKMLCAYYDKSCDSRSLFDDLEIATNQELNKTYLEHLNKYPTIYVDMTYFVSKKAKFGNQIVSVTEEKLAKEMVKSHPEIIFDEPDSFPDVLTTIHQSTGEYFVFIMDEWDAILWEYADNPKVIEEWIDFLRSLFKDTTISEVFAGVYITGILPIIKYDSQTALNSFIEYNMIQPKGIEK